MGIASSSNSPDVQDDGSKPCATPDDGSKPCATQDGSSKSVTAQATEKDFDGQVVKCGIIVKHNDVSKFISENSESLSDEDRQVLQACFELFESRPEFVWRHCAIEVMCPSLWVRFVSGNETNRYIVRIKDGEVVTPNMNRSHLARAYDGFLWIWSHAKDTVGRIRNLAIEYMFKKATEGEEGEEGEA